MSGGLQLSAAQLAADAADLEPLTRFYVDGLGLAREPHGLAREPHGLAREPDGLAPEPDGDPVLALDAGGAALRFVAAGPSTRPFYHFALLVPGNRFSAAREWLAARAALLPRAGTDRTIFEFEAWQARACYCHDPAGNILELIAHHGVRDSDRLGPFQAGELRGLSEVGLVAAGLRRAVEALGTAGLPLWSGSVESERTGLAFVGRQAHTLICCAPGRPWLPTGRPAESHPVTVSVSTGSGSVVSVRVRDGHLSVGA